jgi:hypothetical protein
MKSLPPETLARIEHLVDSDGEWWPFAFARPQQHERFGTLRCALLAALYGVPASLVCSLLGRLAGDPIDDARLVGLLGSVCALTFVVFRFVLAVFWNRRAERLQLLVARRRVWQGEPRAMSEYPLAGGQPHDQGNCRDRQEGEENELGDAGCRSRDAAESE